MTRYWLTALGVSLGLTLCIELGFALLCRKRGRALLITALVNLLTNPPAVLCRLLWRYFALPCGGLLIALMEISIVFLEGLLYKKSREFSRPWLFSLGANALSFGLGVLLQRIL